MLGQATFTACLSYHSSPWTGLCFLILPLLCALYYMLLRMIFVILENLIMFLPSLKTLDGFLVFPSSLSPSGSLHLEFPLPGTPLHIIFTKPTLAFPWGYKLKYHLFSEDFIVPRSGLMWLLYVPRANYFPSHSTCRICFKSYFLASTRWQSMKSVTHHPLHLSDAWNT